jgi:hypothetical protein
VNKGLTYRSEFGLDLGVGQQKRYYGPLTGESRNVGGNLPLGEITQSNSNGYRWTNTLNYRKSVGKHDFSVLGGQELNMLNRGFSEFNRAKFFAENIEPEKMFANMTLGTQDRHTTTVFAGERIASFFGRVNYQFDSRYLLTMTLRADGSTKFAPGNQWGYFPAAALAWRVSQEDFMQRVKFVDDLKFRISYGQAVTIGSAMTCGGFSLHPPITDRSDSPMSPSHITVMHHHYYPIRTSNGRRR